MVTDFEEKSQEYGALLDLIARLIDAQAGKKISEGEAWLNDAQTLSLKLFKHLTSMRALASVTTFQHENPAPIRFIDHSSIQVVARARSDLSTSTKIPLNEQLTPCPNPHPKRFPVSIGTRKQMH